MRSGLEETAGISNDQPIGDARLSFSGKAPSPALQRPKAGKPTLERLSWRAAATCNSLIFRYL
jgi:hypothetical protein